MKKFLKLLTLFSVIFVGSIFLIGIIGPSPVTYDGPIVGTAGLNKDETNFTLLSEDKTGLTFRLDVGKIEFVSVTTKEGNFVLPRIGKFTRSFRIGEPCLPIGSKLFSIPFGCKLNAEVIKFTTKEIKVPGLILPVQPSISKSTDPATVPFEYNRALYASGKYELPLVSTKIPGIMRATRLGQVFISPLVYYPTENRATVYKSVTIRVTYQNPNWALTNKMQRRFASFFFEPLHRGLLNYKSSEFLRHDLLKYPIRYVIVANRMFESQLQPFITWKTKKGFAVTVGYTDVIGTTTTAIKSYIQNLYNTLSPAPSFVLFVGDVQQIPAFSGAAGSHVTDLNYCEYTSDNIPEIYYGRFSAQSTAELQPQIDKTLEYEQYTMTDPSYLGEVTLISGVDSGYAGTYGNGQINYGTNLYFNASHGISPNVWLYPASDGSSAPSDIRATINAGIGFYNYTAHGSHTGPSDPALTTSDIPSLTNNHKYLLGIANACLTNTFGSDYSTPCFGEAWLQAANKGGIGWIGGSNSTYWDEDYWFGVGSGPIVAEGPTYAQTGQGAYDGIFHDHSEPVYHHYTTNGAIIFAGNTAVVEAGSSRIQYYWEIYHLMGDPSVMTYMGVAGDNTVYHASSVTTTATSFNVQAVPGSYVGITKSGVLHGAAYVGTSGAVDVPLTAFGSSGTATIVVTCQNKEPYEANIPINAGTAPPVANFVGTPTSGTAPLTVNFTDTSSNGPTSWSWTFGDGGASTSQNPSHIYTTQGSFTVTLTATNAYGSDGETKTSYITVLAPQPPVAAFTASNTNPTVGSSVTFTDQSTNNPTSWSWSFPGGTPSTSTAQNPTITYNTVGTYNVSLTATNAQGSDDEVKANYITVSSVPYCTSQGSNYSYEWIARAVVGSMDNSSGAAGYTDFTSVNCNLSGGNSVSVSLTPGFSSSTYTEYWKIWIDYNGDHDFADAGEEVFSGSGTSTVTGSFTVASGVNITTRMRITMKYNAAPTACETFSYGEVEDYTAVITSGGGSAPVAAFTANTTTVVVGGSVSFTDQSTNSPTSWSWSFAGGTPSTSTTQNPTITYNTVGTYNVTLTATNAYGSDGETKANYITVTSAPGDEIAEGVDYAGTFTRSGNANWTKVTDVYYYGSDSARSGTITHSQSTTIETSVTVASTQAVKFYWKVSSESGYDYLRFYIDGVQKNQVSGTVDWTQVSNNIAAGTHTLKWTYSKDGSVSSGSDCGWVDKLEITTAASDPLAEALDYPGLTFTLSGTGSWYSQTATTYYGGDAAQSPVITHSQSSSMETAISGKTSVKFYWKVSSEANYDYLRFYIDGVLQTSISGTVNWAQKTYTVTSGAHTLKWTYVKDGSVSSGSDAGWVDKLELQ